GDQVPLRADLALVDARAPAHALPRALDSVEARIPWPSRRRGRVARQRPAKPRTPVRFWSAPLTLWLYGVAVRSFMCRPSRAPASASARPAPGLDVQVRGGVDRGVAQHQLETAAAGTGRPQMIVGVQALEGDELLDRRPLPGKAV